MGAGGGRVRSPRRRKDGDGGAAPSLPMPTAASYDDGEYDDEYNNDDDEYDNDVFPDNNLCHQWSHARRPVSPVYKIILLPTQRVRGCAALLEPARADIDIPRGMP